MAIAPESPDEHLEHDVVVAITTVLTRSCLGRSRAGDADTARELLTELNERHVDKLVRGAAAGGVMAAFPPPLAAERTLVLAARICARTLLAEDQPDQWSLLGAQALALMAVAGLADSPGEDLLFAAEALRQLQQHDLVAWSARRCVESAELTGARLVYAWLLLAQETGDPQAAAEARSGAAGLPADSAIRQTVESTFGQGAPHPSPPGGPALDDRTAAAHRVLGALDEIKDLGHDDDLLAGLRTAMTAYANPGFDLPLAREGLTRSLRHWRARRGLGQLPRGATAGLDAAIDLLLIHRSSDEIILLCELLEAFVDAGLNRGAVGWGTARSAPAVLQAALSRRAAAQPVWPDLAELLDRLGERDALLVYPRQDRDGTVSDVLCVYLRHPGGFAARKVRLDQQDRTTVSALGGRPLTGLVTLEVAAVDRLVTNIVPRAVADDRARFSDRELVVVAAGPLAAIPWGSVTVLGHPWIRNPVVLGPSMSVAGAASRAVSGAQAVHAIVDERLPGVQELLSGLPSSTTRHRGLHTLPQPFRAGDVLLIFTHGSGDGLEYQLNLPAGPATVVQLASLALPSRVVIAACRSGGPPPVAFPLALPNALLISGVDLVVAGLWPLPSEPTANILGDAFRRSDGRLGPAVREAVRGCGYPSVVEPAGLAVFGRDDR